MTSIIFCTCCQYPGCCCCCLDAVKYTRCGTDLLTCANCCPFLVCCRVPPERTVLFLGQEGSGKTSTLYALMFNKMMQKGQPTKGFNNEVITFNKWQSYEFWDPGGSTAQRSTWKRYYSRINFDFLVYFVNGFKYYSLQKQKDKENLLNEDRMELHCLFNEMELRKTKIIVFINFQSINVAQVAEATKEIREELELSTYPVKFVNEVDELKKEMEIETDPSKSQGCFC